MLPSILACSFCPTRKKKKSDGDSFDTDAKDLDFWYSVHFNRYPPTSVLRSDDTRDLSRRRRVDFWKAKKRGETANKVSNFTDLIQRVTASCLLHPIAGNRRGRYDTEDENEAEEEEEEGTFRTKSNGGGVTLTVSLEMITVMEEVFAAAVALKRAYVALQEAHSPWDPENMHAADVAVVAELRQIGVLRERFRRMRSSISNGDGGMLRKVLAPYDAVVDELKREVKVKDIEIENLKEKLKLLTISGHGSKKSRSVSSRRVSCSTQMAVAPVPELFEMTMAQVKEASKSFTGLLLSLMEDAQWDIAAAVRSIEAASMASTDNNNNNIAMATIPSFFHSSVPTQHAKYVLESYICRKIFQGFDHEAFYIDGNLSSILNPDQYRRDCFAQFKDMKAMDPIELLSILPACHFGKFCSKKYLSIVHPKMEESLFGDSNQGRLVLAGTHPRTQFYGEFLTLAKAVWLLHLLAFSLDPPPSHFEASRGAEFHGEYMESVVRFSRGRVPAGQVVGFPVSPGFKLGSHGKGSVIKTRVYLVPKA